MALLLESQRPTRKQFRLDDLFDDDSELVDEPTIDRNILKDRARWIRDDLDLEVAREGPNHLTADQVVLLFKFLGQLRQSRVPLEDIRWSRVHHAVGCIAARATRWPRTLIEEAEKVLENWTIRYGDVDEIGSPLYEEGGRLFGVCTPDDVSKEVLEIKWLRAKDSKTVTGYSHRQGDMGFKPGDWWINSTFAYHAGIIDNADPSSRVIFDKRGAYALLLSGNEEIDSCDADLFTFRARSDDAGRYKLTAASPTTREPIRILRSHTLKSFWAPRAGVRYDGLYRVVGWRIKYNGVTRSWCYDIDFRRLSTEPPMSEVLHRPTSDEVDDYKEYKRIRQTIRSSRNAFGRAKPLVEPAEPIKNAEITTMVMKSTNPPEDYFTLPIAPSAPTRTPGLSPPVTPGVKGRHSPMRFLVPLQLSVPASPRVSGTISPHVV